MSREFLVALTVSLLLVGCAESTPIERYGFIARLGRDTISVESVTRYRDRFVSEEVDRFPQVKRRHTEVRLAADGSPSHMDMRVHTPSAEAKSRERRIVARFDPDTVRVSLTNGDGTRTVAMATEGMLTIPHVPQMYSLLELYFAAALERAAADSLAAGATVNTRQFYPDREFSNYPIPMHKGYVRRLSGDTVEIRHYWLAGTATAVVDSNHRMLSYSGARTTYLVEVDRLNTPPDVEAIGAAFAAAEQSKPVNALSVRDTVRATIGPAAFTVDYGRPRVRGRTLLGEVIPYNQVWRTGANEATQFSTSQPITLGGIALEPGTYTLWTRPRRDGVALIVNRQTGQWGTGYGPAHDIGRVPMTIESPGSPAEEFTISIEPKGSQSGILSLSWGSFRWTTPIQVTSQP
jgi:hypothetical protein